MNAFRCDCRFLCFRMRRFLDWIPVVFGIALLSTLVGLQWNRVIHGTNDFVALYAGAELVGTPELYSRTANESVIRDTIGTTMDSVIYTRPPFYAVLLKPLTALPYLAAYAVFCVLCISSILWFTLRFSKECDSLPLLASFSIPLASWLPQGQDAPLLLAFVGVSILLTRRKLDFLAGMALSLCVIKFHLFLLIPILLLAKKRWRILAGGATGTGILLALGMIVAGAQSLQEWVRVLRDPWINFSSDMMPNLHGLSAGLNHNEAAPLVEIGMVGAVVAVFLWICRKTDNYECLFALSLMCSLLVSYHSGISDQILLLPVLVLLVGSCQDKPLRIALAVSLTPMPYFTGIGINVVMPLVILAVLTLAAVAVSRQGSMVPVEHAN
jgi:hypothetical protein